MHDVRLCIYPVTFEAMLLIIKVIITGTPDEKKIPQALIMSTPDVGYEIKQTV